jgi:hypothetical protein
MQNNGRRIFMQQFERIDNLVLMLETRDLIDVICRITGVSNETVKSRVINGYAPESSMSYAYIRLSEIFNQTHAWVVRGDDGKYRIDRGDL